MPYRFQAGKMYRMPTHFGPRTGPRQGENSRKFDNRGTPKTTTISVSFLSNREQLEALLPECFEMGGEPIVTAYASYMTEIEWLAGRGYNVLGVSFPATYNGEQDHVSGSFLTVRWENLTDPIITGREELGYAKIYCELPEPTVLRAQRKSRASYGCQRRKRSRKSYCASPGVRGSRNRRQRRCNAARRIGGLGRFAGRGSRDRSFRPTSFEYSSRCVRRETGGWYGASGAQTVRSD